MSKSEATVKQQDFGLETLLAPKAEFRYETLFSTRRVGRVLDFVMHEAAPFLSRSKNPGSDEYRIRQILQLAIFNAWGNYRRSDKTKCINFEFGWDKEKLILAVTHYVDDDVSGFSPDSKNPSNDTATRMSKMYMQIQAFSDGLILRHDVQSGRVQAIATVLNSQNSDSINKVQMLTFNNLQDYAPSQQMGKTAELHALSSGNVEKFNLDEKKELELQSGSGKSRSWLKRIFGGKDEADETIVVSGKKGPQDESVQVRGSLDVNLDKIEVTEKEGTSDSDEKIVVKGKDQASEDDKVKVKGGSENIQDELQRVKGKLVEQDETAIVLSADEKEVERALALKVQNLAPDLDQGKQDQFIQELVRSMQDQIEKLRQDHQEQLEIKEQKYKENLQVLQGRIEALKEERQSKTIAAQTTANGDEEKTFTFKNDSSNDQDDTVQVVKGSSPSNSESEEPSEAEALEVVEKWEKAQEQQERSFQERVRKYNDEIENSGLDDRAKRWAHGFMEDLLKDRSVLIRREREIEAHLRKREHEFRQHEQKLRQRVTIFEEDLRQKESVISNLKETVSNTLAKLEKSQQQRTGMITQEDLERKLEEGKKALLSANEKTERYAKRVEELQKKASEDAATRTTLLQDLSKQRHAADTYHRKLIDSEVQIKELQAKLASKTGGSGTTKSGAGSGNEGAAETKHKLDQANKLVKALKEELSRSRKKFDDLKLEETNLKVQITRLQEQLKKK